MRLLKHRVIVIGIEDNEIGSLYPSLMRAAGWLYLLNGSAGVRKILIKNAVIRHPGINQ